MGNVLRGVILAGLAVGMAAGQIVLSPAPGGGGGGGAPTDATYWVGSANGSLSAEIVVNDIASLEAAIAAYDFNDAANLTTGDLAAARMQTNVRTAIGAGLTNDRMPRVDGGVLVDDGTNEAAIYVGATKRFWVDTSGNSNIASGRRLYYSSSTWISGNANVMSPYVSAGGSYNFLVDNQLAVKIGDGQTMLVQDQTATTGDTLFIVRRGAGESGNVFEVNWGAAALDYVAVSSAGTLVGQTNSQGVKYQLVLADSTFRLASDHHIKFNSTTNLNSGALDTGITRSSAGVMKITDASTGYGSIDAASYNLGGTGAIIYPPSASEPVDCTTSNDGSMYFDTTDQTMCVCANDGADEWQKIQDMTTDCSI